MIVRGVWRKAFCFNKIWPSCELNKCKCISTIESHAASSHRPAGPYFSVFYFLLLSNTWLPWCGPKASWWKIHNWFWSSLPTSDSVLLCVYSGHVLWSVSFSFTLALICPSLHTRIKGLWKWGRLDVVWSVYFSFFLSPALSHFFCCSRTHTNTGSCLFSWAKQMQHDGLFCRWRQDSNDIKTVMVTFREKNLQFVFF